MQTPQFGGRTDAAGAWNCSSCSIQTASMCVACGPSSVVGEDIESQVGEGDGGRATGAQLATNDRMVEGAEPMPSWMVPPSVGDNTLLSSKTAPLPVGPPSPQICVDPVHARQDQRGAGPGGRNPSRKNRAAAALSTANIMATFETEICDDCCIQNFKVQSDAPFTAVQCARAERVNGNRGEEQQWLWLTLSSMWNGADFSWTFGGHATCFHCWSALMGYGRNNTKVCSARAAITREFKQSGTLLTTPRQGATLGRPPIAGGKQAMAKQWFHKYVERNGDFDPTRNRVFISKRPLTQKTQTHHLTPRSTNKNPITHQIAPRCSPQLDPQTHHQTISAMKYQSLCYACLHRPPGPHMAVVGLLDRFATNQGHLEQPGCFCGPAGNYAKMQP